VSCNQYDSTTIKKGVSAQTIAQLKLARIEFVNSAKNNPKKTSIELQTIII
jgi:hypothetical protein